MLHHGQTAVIGCHMLHHHIHHGQTAVIGCHMLHHHIHHGQTAVIGCHMLHHHIHHGQTAVIGCHMLHHHIHHGQTAVIGCHMLHHHIHHGQTAVIGCHMLHHHPPRADSSHRLPHAPPLSTNREELSHQPISGSVSEMEVPQHSTGLGSAESSKVTSHEQDIATAGVGVPPSPGDSRSARNSGLQSLPSQRRTNGPTVSSLPLGHSGQSLMPLIRASVTPATWQVYGKAWEEWCSLVKGRPVDTCVRARCDVVVELLNLLKSRGASGTLAQRNLTGVAFFFQLMGWADVTKYFFIKQAVKGWKRLQPSQECCRPISLRLLHDIITKSETVCKSQYESALISTAFAIAFFGALRISELVPHSKTALIGGLINEDLVICSDALRIRVRKSKCDPTGRGSWVLVKALEGPICPVKIVRHYAVIRHESRFFLSHTDGSPLTKYQFHTIFKKCLQAVGVDSKEYGMHSFRI
ncbi:uncharacterized protein [Dendrobates tinctorius]|uniref:uncharacterized protein isoform X1 n=1 Tax=Dendrobates tinctorius TaxID=92724 RepID=UPI003CCA3F46